MEKLYYFNSLKIKYGFENLKDDVMPFVLNQNKLNLKKNVELIWDAILSYEDGEAILTPALPRGNIEANIMIVGQNPGGRGIDGRRYTTLWNDGPTSKFVMDCVRRTQIFKHVWFTNLYPFPTSNNKVNRKQVKKTKYLLDLQIELIKPKVIVGFGKTVCNNLKNNKHNIPLIQMYHPTYINRFYKKDEKMIEEYLNTLSLAKKYV